jgi:hypothetical protein
MDAAGASKVWGRAGKRQVLAAALRGLGLSVSAIDRAPRTIYSYHRVYCSQRLSRGLACFVGGCPSSSISCKPCAVEPLADQDMNERGKSARRGKCLSK